MPSPFPCSPVIRECSWNKTQIGKKNAWIWRRVLSQLCKTQILTLMLEIREKSAVKQYIEKPISLNYVNLSMILCPGHILWINFICFCYISGYKQVDNVGTIKLICFTFLEPTVFHLQKYVKLENLKTCEHRVFWKGNL